eukprot:scaffold125654_cov36-Phaeocystis_antarctica.AAC.1
MPYGSKGRTAQAGGKVVGTARATLLYTVPHNQKVVTKELEKLQKAVNKLVMGPRRVVTAEEAVQPRKDMGIGGGKTVAGQRQQKAETQPATRSKEREGDGRKGDKRRRRAWPHRTKHEEPDASRGAESEIPRKTGA